MTFTAAEVFGPPVNKAQSKCHSGSVLPSVQTQALRTDLLCLILRATDAIQAIQVRQNVLVPAFRKLRHVRK